MQENYYQEVQEIIDELGANAQNVSEATIRIYFKKLLKQAMNITNNRNYKDLIPYVQEATIATVIRRGNEGMTARTEGSMSSTYNDIIQKMKEDLVSANLRRLK